MAPLEPLRSLPDHARVWIYAADRTLGESEQIRLIELLDSFCANWRSHGRPVKSTATVIEGRFAVIAGEIPGGDISGCGIDASVHALDEAANELGLRWMPALSIHFRGSDGSISSVSRSEFRSMARSGDVTSRTRVFDLSLQSVGDLRAGRFEQPAESTWHGSVFGMKPALVS